MADDSVSKIRDSLIAQQWIPRTLVYSDTKRGKVDCVVYNVHADDNSTPFVRFEATRTQDYSRVFETLRQALNHIGVF